MHCEQLGQIIIKNAPQLQLKPFVIISFLHVKKKRKIIGGFFFTHILLSIVFLVAIFSQKITYQSSAWFSNLICGKMCLFVNYSKKIKSNKFLSECKIVQMWTVNLKEHLVKRSSLIVLLLTFGSLLHCRCGSWGHNILSYKFNFTHASQSSWATNRWWNMNLSLLILLCDLRKLKKGQCH